MVVMFFFIVIVVFVFFFWGLGNGGLVLLWWDILFEVVLMGWLRVGVYFLVSFIVLYNLIVWYGVVKGSLFCWIF